MRVTFFLLLLSSVLSPLTVLAQECGLIGINESLGLRHKQGDNGKWGVLDENNALIIPFRYEFTKPMTSDLIKVATRPTRYSKWGAVNRQGRPVLPEVYDWLEPAGCQHMQGKKDGVTYLFSAQGKVLYQAVGNLEFEMYPRLHRLVVSKVHADPARPSRIIIAVLDTRTYRPAVPASKLVGEIGATQLFTTVMPDIKKQPFRKVLPFFAVMHRIPENGGGQSLSRLMDVQGHMLFDSVSSYSFSPERGVVFIYRNNRLPHIVTDTLLRPIKWLSGKYDFVQHTGPNNRWWLVTKNKKFGVLDGTGKFILPVKYKAEDVEYVGNNWFKASNGVNRDFTFISTSKKVVDLRGYYLERTDRIGSRPFVVTKRATYKSGIFDLREGFMLPPRFDALVTTNDGLVFFQGDSAGYMDSRGHLKLLTSHCQSLSTFRNGYAVCGKLVPNASRRQFPSAQIIYSTEVGPVAVQYAYMDATGKLISGYFDWVGPFQDGYALVTKNDETFMINKRGHRVQTGNGGQLVSYFKGGVALAKLGNTYTLVNKAGKPVLPGVYRSIATEQLIQANSTIYTKNHSGNHMLALTVPKLEDGAVEVETMNNQTQRLKIVLTTK